MPNEKDMTSIFKTLDDILGQTDLSDVTAESTPFSELPDGYYLTEVEKAELKESKSSHMPMVAFQLNVVEDGLGIDENGKFFDIKKTKGRKVFLYYVLKDDASVRRFATDMLKFEGSEQDKPILDKEYFMNSQTLVDALDILVGMRIYCQSSTTINKDDTTSNWKNLISWKRARMLELPE